MTVYFRKPEEATLFMAEVNVKEEGGDINLFRKNLWGIPKAHREMLLKMRADEIAVIGNKAPCGDGIYKDNYLFEITEIESKFPKVFLPLEENKIPTEEEIEKKYERRLRHRLIGFVENKRKARKTDPENTSPLTKEEVDNFEKEQKTKLETEKAEELRALKEYREKGIVSQPVKMYHFGTEENKMYDVLQDEKMQVDDATIILALAKKYGTEEEVKRAEKELSKAKEALQESAISHINETKTKSPGTQITIESIMEDKKDSLHAFHEAARSRTL